MMPVTIFQTILNNLKLQFMKISKNIMYNSKILNSEKSDVHRQNLEIASINLDDLNKRLNSDVSLLYDELKFKFKYDTYSELAFDFKTIINQRCTWAHQDDKNSDDWVKPCIDSILKEKDDILTYANNPLLLDIEHFKYLRNKFVKRYKDHSPLGFLSSEVEQKIKDLANNYCSDLLEVPAK